MRTSKVSRTTARLLRSEDEMDSSRFSDAARSSRVALESKGGMTWVVSSKEELSS